VRAQTKHVRDNVGLAILKILYSTNLVDPLAEKFLINPQRYLHALVKEIIVFGQSTGEFRTDVDADELTLLSTAPCDPCSWTGRSPTTIGTSSREGSGSAKSSFSPLSSATTPGLPEAKA